MDGQWWRLATNMFLHFGIVHLGMNMWVLWDVGRLVERLVGNLGFAVLYLISGLAASIASLAWNPTVISAGASGAVFGVVGGLLAFVLLRRDTIPKPVAEHLMKTLGIFLAYNVIYGLQASRIDHAAHLGGLLAGCLCGLALSQPLSPQTVANRWRRNLITASVSVPLLMIACAALPPAPPDAEAELQRLAEVEEKSLRLFNDLATRTGKDAAANAEVADAIAAKILPPWAEMRARLEALIESPLVDRKTVAWLVKYMKERESAWHLYVDALREDDAEKLQRANERMRAADSMEMPAR